MATLSARLEKQRKQPVQARSAATVEAILEASVQVLIRVGKEKLTTTLVAQRAGVSVGTLYQYFPNKRSLLQAVLRRHLIHVTETFEAACALNHGRPLCEMVTAVANAFFQAKMVEPKVSLALYSVSADVDGLRITEDLRQRNVAAFERALATSPEVLLVDAAHAAFVMQSAMIGVTRAVLETKVPRDLDALREQMVEMLVAYVAGITSRKTARVHTEAS